MTRQQRIRSKALLESFAAMTAIADRYNLCPSCLALVFGQTVCRSQDDRTLGHIFDRHVGDERLGETIIQ